MKWSDRIDPATIPDAVLKSERARRNAAKRVKPTGGTRPGAGRPRCKCGICQACQRRAKPGATLADGPETHD